MSLKFGHLRDWKKDRYTLKKNVDEREMMRLEKNHFLQINVVQLII